MVNIENGNDIYLKNGRFGEYTEFDGFNKASKLPPEDKPKNPKVSYYNPHELDYENKDTRLFVLKSLKQTLQTDSEILKK